jgi:hypothetical protein
MLDQLDCAFRQQHFGCLTVGRGARQHDHADNNEIAHGAQHTYVRHVAICSRTLSRARYIGATGTPGRERLQLAHRAWTAVSSVEGEHVARL